MVSCSRAVHDGTMSSKIVVLGDKMYAHAEHVLIQPAYRARVVLTNSSD